SGGGGTGRPKPCADTVVPGSPRPGRKRHMAIAAQQYNVGGILLPRPFKVRRLGHFGFNADKVAEGLEFYNGLLGFKISDELDFAKVPGFPEQVKTLGD